MGIEFKSLGFLIDELTIVNMKCWWAQEDLVNLEFSAEKRAAAGMRALELNTRRNALIRAIDERFGDTSSSPTPKSYGEKARVS
jgi:hypothetical protein